MRSTLENMVTQVLEVDAVSKRFWVQRNRPVTLKESVSRWLTGKFERSSQLWALRDVRFSVDQGRTLAIIGHNGAGKSTLLRLICGLGRPTSGKIRCAGHIGSLLELGSGFHPEMSGRENLMTGGILSGLTKHQVRAKEDEIIAFAELEEFIDQPVRTYSTGMYMRLAFATAVNFDPDFLVIDEVLAVGDSRFQAKCLDRLNAFRKAGKAFVFVSHDLDQVRGLCDEVLVLEEGRVVMHADPEGAINCYHELMAQRTERKRAELYGDAGAPDLSVERGKRMGTQEAMISAVRLYDEQGRAVLGLHGGDGLRIELEYVLARQVGDLALALGVFSEANIKCFECSIQSVIATFGHVSEKGTFACRLPHIPLQAGIYYINVGLYPTDWNHVYDYHWHMHPLRVLNVQDDLLTSNISGIALVAPEWSHSVQT
jgi:lipopolysaccharide transport system ATP-binding protein